jgi:hypothetical protein
VCDPETSRIGDPYLYDISNLRVNVLSSVVLVAYPYFFPRYLINDTIL